MDPAQTRDERCLRRATVEVVETIDETKLFRQVTWSGTSWSTRLVRGSDPLNAAEARGVMRTTRAVVARDLWIRAQRPRHAGLY